MTPKERLVTLTFQIPMRLRDRTYTASKIVGTSMKGLICIALGEKLDQIEAAQRERDTRDLEEKAKRKEIRVMGKRTALSPTPLSEMQEQPKSNPATEKVYIEHAKKIYEVLGNPIEKRIRIETAVNAVRKLHPITCPSDKVILTKLEHLILELGTQEPEPQLEEEGALIGKPVNNTIPVFGDVDDD